MECWAVNEVLQDYIDGKLISTDAKSVFDHHKKCPSCAEQYTDALAVIEILRGVRVPPSSPGFSTRVIAHATGSTNTVPVRSLPYVASGIAASLIAFFVLVSSFFNPVFEDQSMPIVLMGGGFQTIKVAIDSGQSIDSVELSIDISDNLAIAGYENQKSINWNSKLSQGVNVIALPVSAIALGDGIITTRVRLNGEEKVFIIKTRYQSRGKVKRDYQTIAHT